MEAAEEAILRLRFGAAAIVDLMHAPDKSGAKVK
jgi:hypothetical protein